MRIRHAGTILNQPVLAGDYEMYYDDRDGILSILVFNSNGNTINSGDPIFSIEPLSENAQLSIMELQISDSYGNVIPNRPEPITPARFELYGAFPNPFNSSTVIKFSLPEPSNVSLSIFNLSGQLVRTINLENYPAGESQVIWDGANQEKQPVASGVYFYRLKAGIFESTKRMTLMK